MLQLGSTVVEMVRALLKLSAYGRWIRNDEGVGAEEQWVQDENTIALCARTTLLIQGRCTSQTLAVHRARTCKYDNVEVVAAQTTFTIVPRQFNY